MAGYGSTFPTEERSAWNPQEVNSLHNTFLLHFVVAKLWSQECQPSQTQRRGKRLRCSSLCHVQPVPSSRFIHSRWGSALSPRSACWHVERAKAMAGAWRPKVGLSGYTDLRYQHIQDLTPCRWESTGNLRNWSNRESWPEPAVCRGRDHNLPQISP